jgi:hypothetical protein
MYAIPSHFSRTAGLWVGSLFAFSGAWAADTAKPESDAFPVLVSNYIKVSGELPSVSGSKAEFQTRTQIPKVGAGGIEDFNFTKDLSKETNLQIDGRVLPGAEDYLAQFRVTKDEVGSFEAGYKRFRTFYDGMGGFFPINNAWLPLYPQALFVDRGKFFVTGTIALPDKPVFTFRYSNETRSGRKSSTIWGDTDLTGIPIWSLSSLNPVSSNRKIVPAYLQLGERQETWEASMKHTVGKTTAVISVIGSRINNLDTRSVDRYPGELKPFPAIPSNPPTLIAATLANNPNRGFDQQGFKENATTLTGKIETVMSDTVTVYVGASYRHADEDIAAARLITADIRTVTGIVSTVGPFTSGGRPPYSYTSAGHLKNNIYTGNIGVEMKPTKDLHIDAGLRVEEYKASGLNEANFINALVVQSTGAVTQQPVYAANSSKIKDTPWTPALDVRYTGIKNVTFYGTFDYRKVPGTEWKDYQNINPSGSVILPTLLLESQQVNEKHLYYRAGANWMPSSMVTLRAEAFKKDHENNFTGDGPSLGSYFILDYDTYGARLTATARATPQLTFTTRYIYQRGKGRVSEDGFVKGDSNDTRTHQFDETVDWAPTKEFYMQGNVNVVFNEIMTAYPKSSGAALDVLHNANNNYWNGSVVAGFVVDKFTDAQLLGTYYRADNYNAALAAATTPYGLSVKEYSLTVGLKHKFSDRLVASAKVGYFYSNNETTGGFANFKGTVAYVSLAQAF